MATAFDTFDQYAFGQYDGQIEDRNHADVITLLATGSDIGYGLALTSPAYREGALPVAEDDLVAISVRESVRDNPNSADNPTPGYLEDHEMSAIRVGRVWVTTVDGAEPGEQVYAVPETGELTNVAEDNIEFPNAVFKTEADAGERVLVQLNGNH